MLDCVKQGTERAGTPLVGSGHSSKLIERWRRLCSDFLPFHEDGDLWRHSRGWLPTDPHQGWKIHVSATILSACDVLEAVGAYLRKSGAAFKAVSSLDCLERLNSGIFHGYSQVGKFITVYPPDVAMFRNIVEGLSGIIPPGAAAPAIPFDLRYLNTNIFYRYGSFISNGDDAPTLRKPDGEWAPDLRHIPCPGWTTPPFADAAESFAKHTVSPLSTRYRVFASLSQRGKGGVYEAIDTGSVPLRLCVAKEGRRHGETVWDGRDGRTRIENEANALRDLIARAVDVPKVYDRFETGGNLYIVLEKLSGKTLQSAADDNQRLIPLADALYVCKQIASLLADIHAAGWVWRDCKPANLFLTDENTVRPIDFEGACRSDRLDAFVWSSPNFSAPEVFRPNYVPNPSFPFAADLYSLGATLYYVIEGEMIKTGGGCPGKDGDRAANAGEYSPGGTPGGAATPPNPAKSDREGPQIKWSRRGVPGPIRSTISRLLNIDPAGRPSAADVTAVVGSVEGHFSEKFLEAGVVAHVVE